MSEDYAIAREGLADTLEAIVPRVGAQRACPDCGRPQHYTGTEMGWCHDATFDMLACGASPALLAELEK